MTDAPLPSSSYLPFPAAVAVGESSIPREPLVSDFDHPETTRAVPSTHPVSHAHTGDSVHDAHDPSTALLYPPHSRDEQFTSPSPAPTDTSGPQHPHPAPSSTTSSVGAGSDFTSISQRGINPAWRPGFSSFSGTATYLDDSARRPQQHRPFPHPPPHHSGRRRSSSGARHARNTSRDDVILTANPDFALPRSASGLPPSSSLSGRNAAPMGRAGRRLGSFDSPGGVGAGGGPSHLGGGGAGAAGAALGLTPPSRYPAVAPPGTEEKLGLLDGRDDGSGGGGRGG